MGEPRSNRRAVHLADREAREIEEYRWRNRVPSQAEAVRQLIKKGLAAETAKDGEAVAELKEV